MRHASSIITINETMKKEIIARSKTKCKIHFVDNPAVSIAGIVQDKLKGFVCIASPSFMDHKNKASNLP